MECAALASGCALRGRCTLKNRDQLANGAESARPDQAGFSDVWATDFEFVPSFFLGNEMTKDYVICECIQKL